MYILPSPGIRKLRTIALLAIFGLFFGLLATLPVSASAATASSGFVALTPKRAADTRTGIGVAARVVAAGQVLQVPVAGKYGIPANASAASLNITVTEPAGSGFATVFPCGAARPNASNLNFTAGQTIPNAALAKLGTGGTVCIYTSAATHLVVDVNGYYPAGSDYSALTPKRAADTRTGIGVAARVVAAGQVLQVPVAGKYGIPANASAASLNITVTEPAGSGFATVFPCGAARPNASNLNFTAGQTIPNAALAKLGTGGTVCIYTSAATHLVVDVNGYYPAGSDYSALTPKRAADTRTGIGVAARVVAAGQVLQVPVAGKYGIPANASAASLNITVTEPAGSGFATVFPCGAARPNASNLNFTAGQTIPNAALAKLGTGGTVCIYTSAATHLVVDVNGYFPAPAPAPDVTPPGPVTRLATKATADSITLTWTNPADKDLAQIIVRRATGTTPPTGPTAGSGVTLASPTATSATDLGLSLGSTYSYAVFTRDTAGNTGSRATATATAAPPPVLRDETVTTGDYDSCALDTAGKAWCWGYNYDGQLGDGTTTGRAAPVAVLGGHGFTSITASYDHTCALDAAGKAWCWGSNGSGQLGDGSIVDSLTPVAVAGGRTYRVLDTDNSLSCALDTAGKAWCWGYNEDGELGDGTLTRRTVPVAVSGSRSYTQLDVGSFGACALDSAGKAWCWGLNDVGELGDGSSSNRTAPVAVAGNRTFTKIDSSAFHSCALDSTGKAWCWGWNAYGQLGDGTGTDRSTPVAAAGGTTFSTIDAGIFHTCALDGTGKAWCWGNNGYGQLGDGTYQSHTSRVAVYGIVGATGISAGGFHTCALDAAGKARCWGRNELGQIGDGTSTGRPVPVAVLPLADTPAVLDSDYDGLSDQDETGLYGTDPFNPDTDGDSLIDGWEVSGHPNGTPLPGADPLRADIYVEMDYMVRASATYGLAPSAAVQARIVQTFADSPQANPDGSTGISLHLNLDDQVPLDTDLSPVDDQFNALRDANFDPLRRGIYHYMVWSDRYDGGTSSGLSFGIDAADFIVTLGGWNGSTGGTDDQKVGTFIHELGHNLGLGHGGGDDVNYKPNYISVMNYAFQVEGVKGPSGRVFDYQRFDLPNLNETALSEPSGLTAGPQWAGYGTTFWCGATRVNTVSLINTDWNCSGSITAGSMSADINNDSQLSVLKSFNDWEHLRFDGGGVIGSSGAVAPGKTSAEPSEPVGPELTWQDYLNAKA